jgi:Fe-S oxidoreductase
MIGFSVRRPIPALSPVTLRRWKNRNSRKNGDDGNRIPKGTVHLFADEFTNFNESDIGIKAVMLLGKLGYSVVIPRHRESGRTFLSKGLLRSARKIAVKNILMLRDVVTDEQPLVGIEPSALLTFRDE